MKNWIRILSVLIPLVAVGLLSGCGGTTANAPARQQPVIQASANHASVAAGESFVLTWTTTNATAVTMQPGGQTLGLNGSLTLTPASTTTYTLTASGAGGSSVSSCHGYGSAHSDCCSPCFNRYMAILADLKRRKAG